MIKIFENISIERLEAEVNEYINTCDSAVDDIQFRSAINQDGLIFHCCIIHDLSFCNSYK